MFEIEVEKPEAAHLIHKIAARISNSAHALTSKEVQSNRPKEHGILENLSQDLVRLERLVDAYRKDAMSIFTGDVPPPPAAPIDEDEDAEEKEDEVEF